MLTSTNKYTKLTSKVVHSGVMKYDVIINGEYWDTFPNLSQASQEFRSTRIVCLGERK